jgi:hypothetical protein
VAGRTDSRRWGLTESRKRIPVGPAGRAASHGAPCRDRLAARRGGDVPGAGGRPGCSSGGPSAEGRAGARWWGSVARRMPQCGGAGPGTGPVGPRPFRRRAGRRSPARAADRRSGGFTAPRPFPASESRPRGCVGIGGAPGRGTVRARGGGCRSGRCAFGACGCCLAPACPACAAGQARATWRGSAARRAAAPGWVPSGRAPFCGWADVRSGRDPRCRSAAQVASSRACRHRREPRGAEPRGPVAATAVPAPACALSVLAGVAAGRLPPARRGADVVPGAHSGLSDGLSGRNCSWRDRTAVRVSSVSASVKGDSTAKTRAGTSGPRHRENEIVSERGERARRTGALRECGAWRVRGAA